MKSGADLEDELLEATSKLSKSKSSRTTFNNSRKTPSSFAQFRTVRTITEGAYPNDVTNSDSKNKSAVPAAIFTPSREQNNLKKYQIFIASESSEELQLCCFTPMGDGSTFCIEKNCKVNYRGAADRFLVAPGEAFIKFSKNRAFKDPSVNSVLWSDEIFNE